MSTLNLAPIANAKSAARDPSSLGCARSPQPALPQ